MILRITGGRKLEGVIPVMGMKNAATPLLAAALLTEEACLFENVPAITDVTKVLRLIESLGASVEQEGNTVRVRAKTLSDHTLDKALVESIRSSVLLLGPLLARFGSVTLPMPGGCIIGNRPIDAHLAAFTQLGADVALAKDVVRIEGKHLRAATVILPEFSVTATENALMLASALPGRTVIKLAAAEPSVQDLGAFLQALGVEITGIGTHTLTVRGVDRFGGAQHTVIPDMLEVGTFLVAAAMTRGRVILRGMEPEHCDAILERARHIGVDWSFQGTDLLIEQSSRLRAFRLKTMPYPGFPTDLQAPFAVLATQAQGTSLIHDPLYDGRMGYVQELVKMGANATVCDPHRVLVSGPTPLYGQEIRGLDLRAGATLVLAGLIAQGETLLRGAEIIDRGYERLDERLRAVGAQMVREDEA